MKVKIKAMTKNITQTSPALDQSELEYLIEEIKAGINDALL